MPGPVVKSRSSASVSHSRYVFAGSPPDSVESPAARKSWCCAQMARFRELVNFSPFRYLWACVCEGGGIDGWHVEGYVSFGVRRVSMPALISPSFSWVWEPVSADQIPPKGVYYPPAAPAGSAVSDCPVVFEYGPRPALSQQRGVQFARSFSTSSSSSGPVDDDFSASLLLPCRSVGSGFPRVSDIMSVDVTLDAKYDPPRRAPERIPANGDGAAVLQSPALMAECRGASVSDGTPAALRWSRRMHLLNCRTPCDQHCILNYDDLSHCLNEPSPPPSPLFSRPHTPPPPPPPPSSPPVPGPRVPLLSLDGMPVVPQPPLLLPPPPPVLRPTPVRPLLPQPSPAAPASVAPPPSFALPPLPTDGVPRSPFPLIFRATSWIGGDNGFVESLSSLVGQDVLPPFYRVPPVAPCFAGYAGQSVLVFDEFTGSFPVRCLLSLLRGNIVDYHGDNYECRVQARTFFFRSRLDLESYYQWEESDLYRAWCDAIRVTHLVDQSYGRVTSLKSCGSQ